MPWPVHGKWHGEVITAPSGRFRRQVSPSIITPPRRRVAVDREHEAFGGVDFQGGAVMNAAAKLEAFGDQLGWPHTSQVKGSRAGIRELRPRAGRSPWRVLYRRVAGAMVMLAVGPEAEHDRGFDRAVRRAEERLKEIEG